MSECTTEDIGRSTANRSTMTCLSRGDAFGVATTIIAGFLSLVAILYILFRIARNVKRRMDKAQEINDDEPIQIFCHSMDVFMASLFFADILQAIGMVMSLRWVQEGKVEIGPFCSAQGIIKIFGATGVAFSTLAVAVYTFLEIWLDAETSKKHASIVVGVIWSFIVIIVGVAMGVNQKKEFSFMAPTPYWCWVNKHDVGLDWKMGVEYLWMWLTLALSIPIYVALQIRFGLSRLVMLAYPVVYCLCILPLSIVRWISFVDKERLMPPAATFTVVSIFALSGFLNTILVLKTRPRSELFGDFIRSHVGAPAGAHGVVHA